MAYLATWTRLEYTRSTWKNRSLFTLFVLLGRACRRECLERGRTCRRIWRCAWTSVPRARHGREVACPRSAAWWPCVRSSAILRSSEWRALFGVCKSGKICQERERGQGSWIFVMNCRASSRSLEKKWVAFFFPAVKIPCIRYMCTILIVMVMVVP